MTLGDIEAFLAHNAEALEAADKAIQRAEKGLPEDRLFDGATGVRAAVRGAWAYKRMAEMLADAWRLKLADEAGQSADAMEAHKDPMR